MVFNQNSCAEFCPYLYRFVLFSIPADKSSCKYLELMQIIWILEIVILLQQYYNSYDILQSFFSDLMVSHLVTKVKHRWEMCCGSAQPVTFKIALQFL